MQEDVLSENNIEAASYFAVDFPDKVAYFLVYVRYKSRILAIRDDRITLPPAAFPVRKRFPHLNELNSASISLQEALRVSDSS